MLNKLKDKLFYGESGQVFRGMFTLLIGAGLARIVGLISIPILARIYSPEDYGVLALYTSFVTLLAPILTLRYVQAIPLPKTEIMAFNLFVVCFRLIVLGTLLLAVILFLFSENIFSWFNMQSLTEWWWLVVLGVSGTALFELFSLWATRKRDYRIIAQTQFSQSLIGNLVKISLGFFSIKPGGLIVGQFLTQSSGIFSYFKRFVFDVKSLMPKSNFNKQKKLVKHYQDFIWFRLPSEFLMILGLQAPVLMASRLFDSNITGQLSFTIIALSLPVNLIGMSISKAYYAEVAVIGRSNPDRIKTLTFDIQKKLFMVAIPIALLVYFLSEWIFVFVFGEQWRIAGQYASILSPFLLLRFTSSPLDQVFNVISTQAVYLFINTARIAGFVLVFVFSLRLSIGSEMFVHVLSYFMAAHYLFVTILVVSLINRAAS